MRGSTRVSGTANEEAHMTIAADAGTKVALTERPAPRVRLLVLRKFARRNPLGTAGGAVVVLMILVALFANVIAPYDPVANAFDRMHEAPGLENWFGTDQFGRDVFSRIVYGARTALIVGFTSAIAGASVGLILGVASAYFGGRIDLIFQRVLDVFMAFPIIILALAVIAIFGTGTHNVIIAITIPFIPRCARVVRSTALAIREMPYVDAARACGFSHSRIILRHMVPNVMAPFLVMITAFVGQAILLEASLSYLGLGVQEPTPAWGLMLQGGAEEYAESAPWIAIFPGLAISLAVFGFSLFGDAVRDELDPRLRSR
jgi:peptide/nickel transport system permease protein